MKPRLMETISVLSVTVPHNPTIVGKRGTCYPPNNSMKTQTVKLEDRTIEVAKLPLGKYAELLKAIRELPKHVKGLDTQSSDTIIEMLPTLIGQSLPDFIEIMTIATPLKREEVEQMGLDEATRVVLAIVEVNNFREAFANIKKVIARPDQGKVK